MNKQLLRIYLLFVKYFRTYDEAAYLAYQAEQFSSLGLDFEAAKNHIKLIYKDYSFVNDAMASEHHTLFSAVSLRGSVSRILEIGTFNGKNAALLSLLFPDAEIVTVDLDDNDALFKDSYNRADQTARDIFIKERNALLGQFGNIKFLQMNSLALGGFIAESFDMVWVDGAHGYPVIAIDIANSLRLLKNDGLLLCDDVFISAGKDDPMYRSRAGFETLTAFHQAALIVFNLIYKRTAFPNCLPPLLKYIAVVRKT